jgi:hypothetical protein
MELPILQQEIRGHAMTSFFSVQRFGVEEMRVEVLYLDFESGAEMANGILRLGTT